VWHDEARNADHGARLDGCRVWPTGG
jgi:hypothetical protein